MSEQSAIRELAASLRVARKTTAWLEKMSILAQNRAEDRPLTKKEIDRFLELQPLLSSEMKYTEELRERL